jgi:antitoxin component of RelBE/YafQ-DinJ toxin-antitoxin module
MAKTGRDIEFEHVPNDETIKAMKQAEKGEVMEASSIDELFDSI